MKKNTFMNTSFKKFIVTLGIVCLGFVQSFAINQIDGDWADYGLTSAYDGYYVIATVQDLEAFKTMTNNYSGTYSSSNAVLTADISVNSSVLDANGELRSDYETAVTRKWTEGMSSFSATASGTSYSGIFDGNNHTISGLYIKKTGNAYLGLFEYLGGATIKNLKIEDSYIQGKSCVGGICGSRASSSAVFTISNCSVNAYIVSNSESAGGIYGGYSSASIIENCVNKGTVVSNGDYVGGICSRWSGTITNCTNQGTVKGMLNVGGIVGDKASTAITLCSNTGTVSGSQYVGGIVGNCSSQINKCCNFGKVEGFTYVGGVAGSISAAMSDVFNVGPVSGDNGYVGGLAGSAGNVSYAYNAGLVSNNSYLTNIGGLCGRCTGTMTSCYYDSDVCPFKAVNNSTYTGATAKTTTQMCSTTLLSGFSSSYWYSGSTSVSSSSITKTDDEFATKIKGLYPYLIDITPRRFPYARIQYYNTGTASSPTWVEYTPIYSTVDFASMNNSSKVFVLMNDIVEASNMSDGTLLETPAVAWNPVTLFKGKLYGRGKTISGLCMTSGTQGGLFAEINNASIIDVNMANCVFKGTSSVGAITATASGEAYITNCNNYCDFNLSTSYLGGICGSVSAESSVLTITHCNNYGNILGNTTNCGGIIGEVTNKSVLNVTACINNGDISGNIVGGILGYAYGMSTSEKGTITQCINNGTISSSTCTKGIGGIVGYQIYFSQVTNCLNTGKIINTNAGGTGGIMGEESSGNYIKYCLNLGSISSRSTAGAICGKPGTLWAQYNYYNSDSCAYKAIANEDERYKGEGRTTEQLISGTLPYQFSSDYWAIRAAEIRNMKKYYYFPYLKCFGEESALLAQVKDCHTVSINFNGGTTTDDIITFYVETEEALLPENVTKEGCTFAGWYDNSNYTSNPFTEVPLTETQPKTFYAKWLANNYTITYELDGGTINKGNITFYTYGYGTMLPTDVTKTGYTFGGWYTNSSFTTQVTSVSSTEYSNKTFYARWDAIPYTITYNANEGTISSTPQTTYYYGSVVNLPTPTRQGYSFNGWYNNSNLTGNEVTAITSTDFGDKAFYAKWTANEYNVSLYTDGGTIAYGDITQYTYGTYTSLPLNVTRTGYTFKGWYPILSFNLILESFTSKLPLIKKIQELYGYGLIQARDSVNRWDTIRPAKLPSVSFASVFSFQEQLESVDAVVSLEMVLSEDNITTDLVLESCGPNKISVIKIVKAYTGLGLSDAKKLVESAPVTVLSQVPMETAQNMKDELDAVNGVSSFANGVGGSASTAIYPTDFGDKYFGAKWDVNVYNVNLQVNGGTNTRNIEEYTYGVGATLPDSTEITREGYTFAGWYINSNNDGLPITEISTTDVGDKTFYAKWNVNRYNVSFNIDEGTINSGKVTYYIYNVLTILPQDVTKFGYTFEGWYDNKDFEGEQISQISEGSIGNKEFWAKWTPRTYSVTLQTNNGTISEGNVTSYTFGTAVTLPTKEQITKTGYEFLGWYDNSSYDGGAVTEITDNEIGNKNFWARWTASSYKVTLDARGGTINSGAFAEYTYGVVASLPTNVSKEGYTFTGWYADEACEGDVASIISSTSTGDKTFYAGWSNTAYAVTLYTNDGVISAGNVMAYTFGTAVALPTKEQISKTGYTFGGWYDNSSCTGTAQTGISADATGNKSFWAKWTVNTYNVTFVTNGGTINSGNVTGYTFGVGANLPSDVTKAGHTFAGWYANAGFAGDRQTRIDEYATEDQTFYANWTANEYTITYEVAGGSIEDATYKTAYVYGGETALPATVSKAGHKFAGWFTNSAYEGSAVTGISATEYGNKTFYAKWTVNSYTVTLNANGGTINNGNVTNYTYGVGATLPADVTKTGYAFNGWYDNDEFAGDAITTIANNETGDKTFFAKFTVNTYNVILVTNEGTINAGNVESYEFGKGATLSTDVTKEGYSFGGWYCNSSYIGGSVSSIASNDMGDKQFWAKWTINEYEVTATAENGTIEGTGSYEYKSPATLKAVPNDGYEFVGWNDNTLTDERIQLTVTKDTTLVANFKEKEKVQIAGSLEIPTLKTEREAQPIDLNGLFTTTEGGEVTYTASSSAPNVVAATVSDGKLFLTVYEYEGEAEITVTATLPNGEKNSVKATAEVILACNIQVEETITNVSCYGEFDGEIALKVTNAAEPYTTKWENETSVEDTIRNIVAGNYSVVITDNENCVYNKTYTVTEPAEMTMKATVKNPTCENADGSVSIVMTGAESATFAWSNEATTQNVASLEKGDYSVVITNTETGCQISDSYTLVEPEAPVISVATTVETACDKADGAVYITANSDDLIYKWSNSKTTKDLVGVRAGDYTLDVVDSKNCKASLNVTVPSIQLKQPEIALVTVSQESGKNLVVWLKENTDLIDYYTIYRVDTAKNKYDKVVDVPYSELSVYEDLQANPMERAWKYKMSATDVCGNETPMSDYHSSLHLMKIKSLGVENHLAWDPYEGIDFDSYVILRKTKVKGVAEIDTLAMIPSDLTSYTDTLPARGTTSYYVGVKLPETINPKTQFLKAESGPFSLAMSNIAEVENNVAVQNVVKSNADVYAIGHTIYVKNPDGLETTIYDINGRKLEMSQSFDNSEFTVKLDGVYLVKVGNEMFKVFVK